MTRTYTGLTESNTLYKLKDGNFVAVCTGSIYKILGHIRSNEGFFMVKDRNQKFKELRPLGLKIIKGGNKELYYYNGKFSFKPSRFLR